MTSSEDNENTQDGVKKQPLPFEVAWAFVLKSIEDHGNTVMQKMRSCLVQRSVTPPFAFLPVGTSEEILNDLESGFWLPWGKLKDAQSKFIASYLNGYEFSACIMQEGDCRRGYPCLEKDPTNLKYFQNEVYSMCFRGNNADDVLTAIKRRETPRRFLGALLKLPTDCDVCLWKNKMDLSIDDIDLLVSGTEYIFVCAWDNEGYINVEVCGRDGANGISV